MAKSPQGFIVVLPGEIIEIPQDDDKSWLTLFYTLPKELVEKFPAALEIPRCPYEVLRTDKYDHIVKDDMMKILIWDSSALSKTTSNESGITTVPASIFLWIR